MIKHKWITVLVGGLILTCLVGCAPGAIPADGGEVPPAQVKTTKPSTVPEPVELQPATVAPISPAQPITEDEAVSGTPMQLPSDDESNESIKLAREDLAQRLGISVDLITVNAVIGQEFTADAFHCRASKERISKQEPAQAISGVSILLSASGRRYEYHASGQTVVFCRPLQ
jgi:hypothetical protein